MLEEMSFTLQLTMVAPTGKLDGVVVLVGMAAFPALFFVLGLHGWLLRVELSVSADGLLTMKWTRWPLSPRLKSLPHADVTDVVITTSDSTEHIVVLTKDEAIPLTSSSTSDNLTAKVAEMKAFLHIA